MSMTNNKLEQFIASLKQAKLSLAEKSALRATLVQTIKTQPIIRRSWLVYHWRLVAMPLVAVLVLGGAISQAAERALPGQLLYPIKLVVNESVARLLISEPAKVAAYEAAVLDKRLSEAEALIQLKKLEAPLREVVRNEVVKQHHKAERLRPPSPVSLTKKIKVATPDQSQPVPMASTAVRIESALVPTVEPVGEVLIEVKDGVQEVKDQMRDNLEAVLYKHQRIIDKLELKTELKSRNKQSDH